MGLTFFFRFPCLACLFQTKTTTTHVLTLCMIQWGFSFPIVQSLNRNRSVTKAISGKKGNQPFCLFESAERSPFPLESIVFQRLRVGNANRIDTPKNKLNTFGTF